MARVSLIEIRFASAVPASVNQISLRARRLHTFHQHFCVLSRVQRQECAPKQAEKVASFGDATLSTGQFGGEAREEVILGLIGSQGETGGNTPASAVRKITLVAWPALETGFNVIDVIDRIRNAVFSVFEPSSKSIVPSSRTVTLPATHHDG